MQAVKVFNNNAVSVVMPDGREAILVGNGLGFGRRPGDVIDKSRVSKVYYVQNELQTKFLKMLDNVTPQVMQAAERAAIPMRGFMLKQTRESDLALFAGIAKIDKIDKPEDTPLRILVPAFVISELKTAFQIGFILFIPFLVIDMVVASVLMSMGMMMMSPVMVSLPFKLMLFVLVDGWHLMLGSLVMSFAT